MKNLTANNNQLLNDLIEINNDRIARYAKAIARLDNVEDADIVSLFEKIGQQSQQFKTGLLPLVSSPDEREETVKASARGKLFHSWTDRKIDITGEDRKRILASCEQVEDLFRNVYADAYKQLSSADENIRVMIKSQAELQEVVHAAIKELRDKS